jgi:AraC family transcriptional regulator, regulatory protein of adaptative response / methylated-DNA-[protein]-cysteine methyltransferase
MTLEVGGNAEVMSTRSLRDFWVPVARRRCDKSCVSVTGRRRGSQVPKLPSMETLDDVRWRAVESRDASRAGIFFYAVRSTGIYCRPGCGSRRPLRRNVEYFASPQRAESDGYRACRRCRPDAVAVADPALEAVIEVCRTLETGDDRTVASLASEVGYSERHLRRSFQERVGVSISTYQRALRAHDVRETLRAAPSVTEAVIDAGYGSMRAFYEHGAGQLGMSPSRYRDGARGETIRFTTVETPLGIVLAAGTERGVCSIQLGAKEPALTKALYEEFPNATISRDDEALEEVAVVLGSAVRGDGDATGLPLDVAGTAFQIRVWTALRAIPVGETRTYAQIAAAVGSPRAVRAVGTACGKNAAALAIPCHRVVRSDGSLGGYRWGLATKAALLDAEKTARSLVAEGGCVAFGGGGGI